jgi:hypothetical protein
MSHPELQRRLGTADAVVIGLGSMIGAGVFVVFGPAAAAAGSGLLIALAAQRGARLAWRLTLLLASLLAVGFALAPLWVPAIVTPGQRVELAVGAVDFLDLTLDLEFKGVINPT